jgi:iron complex transport system substrate-binding protein
MRRHRALRAAAILIVLGGVLGACGSSGSSSRAGSSSRSTTASAPTKAASGYPVSITNCDGPTITFDRAPGRVVSSTLQITDDMIALGLQSHLVGVYSIASPIAPQYTKGYAQVHNISSQDFTLEDVVGEHPELLYSGWDDGLTPDTSLTPDNLAKYGIKTLINSDTCGHVDPAESPVSLNTTVYRDLTNLGEIFNVRPRAARLIAQMKAQVAAVQAKVAKLKPVSVFVYNDGTATPGTAPGLAPPTALLRLAGGTNIFAGLKQDWTTVSWEQVVADDPQCVVIKDSSDTDGNQAERFFRTSPITKHLTAVHNNCFLQLAQDELNASSRNAQAIVALARWLHPAAFGLPADGS